MQTAAAAQYWEPVIPSPSHRHSSMHSFSVSHNQSSLRTEVLCARGTPGVGRGKRHKWQRQRGEGASSLSVQSAYPQPPHPGKPQPTVHTENGSASTSAAKGSGTVHTKYLRQQEQEGKHLAFPDTLISGTGKHSSGGTVLSRSEQPAPAVPSASTAALDASRSALAAVTAAAKATAGKLRTPAAASTGGYASPTAAGLAGGASKGLRRKILNSAAQTFPGVLPPILSFLRWAHRSLPSPAHPGGPTASTRAETQWGALPGLALGRQSTRAAILPRPKEYAHANTLRGPEYWDYDNLHIDWGSVSFSSPGDCTQRLVHELLPDLRAPRPVVGTAHTLRAH